MYWRIIMRNIKDEDVEEFMMYVLTQEQVLDRENPIQSQDLKTKKQRDFVKKLDEISKKIARRENIHFED